MYLYRRMFTAEDMVMQDEYLTSVSCRMMIIGKAIIKIHHVLSCVAVG